MAGLSRPGSGLRDARGLRPVLATLGASAALPGAWATLAPRGFYDDFPGVSAWVAPLGPYDGHLVTDVGAFYLAFAVLFAWAAWRPARELVLPLCAAWTLFGVLHLGWHATHRSPFGAGDAAALLGSLALVAALPGVAVAAVARRPPDPPTGSASR